MELVILLMVPTAGSLNNKRGKHWKWYFVKDGRYHNMINKHNNRRKMIGVGNKNLIPLNRFVMASN